MTAPSESPPVVAPALPLSRKPSFNIGAGGWDCHAHVFGPVDRFPFLAERTYTPPEQTVADYLNLLDFLGLSYGVLVQPSIYGINNECMYDAMRYAGGRLISIVDIDIIGATDREIEQLTDFGVRGVRLRWPQTTPNEMKSIADRIRSFGWHIDIYCQSSSSLTDLHAQVDGLRVPMMVEAMGSPRATEKIDTPGFQSLLRMLDEGQVYVKLSHPYQIDAGGPPYTGTTIFANEIVRRGPSRVVWGSDWPHPMSGGGTIPDDADLLDLLLEWAGSTDMVRRVLIDNPRAFYGFPS